MLRVVFFYIIFIIFKNKWKKVCEVDKFKLSCKLFTLEMIQLLNTLLYIKLKPYKYRFKIQFLYITDCEERRL